MEFLGHGVTGQRGERCLQCTVILPGASGVWEPDACFLSWGEGLADGISPVFCFRGLCVDALIELSDENADWKLSFQEFLKCLNPSFNPPEKSMSNLETVVLGIETFQGRKDW